MNIFSYYLKELIFKILYILIISITLLLIIILKTKTILFFLLSPLKETIISSHIYLYTSEVNLLVHNSITNTQFKFLPLIEITLPFVISSYYYYKYIILFSIYLITPLLLYIITITINVILYKKEYRLFLHNIKWLMYILLMNSIVTQYCIIPLYIKYTFSHLIEFQFYEFDIELKLINYLDLYINVLYTNILIVFFYIYIKKHIKVNNYIVYILILILLPNEIMLQTTYVIVLTSCNMLNNIIIKYRNKIKKYKLTELEVKH